jgi:hypothetical protein
MNVEEDELMAQQQQYEQQQQQQLQFQSQTVSQSDDTNSNIPTDSTESAQPSLSVSIPSHKPKPTPTNPATDFSIESLSPLQPKTPTQRFPSLLSPLHFDRPNQTDTNIGLTDPRQCVLCHKTGDIDIDGDSEGRLLPVLNPSDNVWIHVQCALWSVDISVHKNGILENVVKCITESLNVLCSSCGLNGASIVCAGHGRCRSRYHFECAKKVGCNFTSLTKIFCPQHLSRTPNNRKFADLIYSQWN